MKHNKIFSAALLAFFTLTLQTPFRLPQLLAEEINLTFSGSWNWNMEKEVGAFTERLDASLSWQAFSFRAELLDRRYLQQWAFDRVNTGLLMGIYHAPT
ncbi:MAG: hypothetical protein LBL06_04430, partial [Treponema sp.]|nr:hypothetical protein [Treponema sp.]